MAGIRRTPPAPLRPRTPVRGDVVSGETAPVAPKAQEALKKLGAVSAPLAQADVDLFVRMRNVQLSLENGVKTKDGRIYGGPPVDRAGRVTKPDDAKAAVGQAFADIAALFKKGFVTEAEVFQLRGAVQKLDALLTLRDDKLLQMLPREVASRLELQLFEPIAALREAASGQHSAILSSIARRDEGALLEKLSSIGDFTAGHLFATVDPAQLAGASAAAVDRLQPGDLVCVGRSGGTASFGVVTGRDPDGLRVELLTQGRDGGARLGLKKVPYDEVAARNPLKLGDHVRLPGGAELWVNHIGQDGRAGGVRRSADGRVHTVGADELARIAGDLTAASTGTAATVRAAAPPRVPHQSSRQSLVKMLDDVWEKRDALASQGSGAIYSMYNAVTEPNPRSMSPAQFLDGLASAATGRPPGAVSNTQSGHGGIAEAVRDYQAGALGDLDKASLERTFFRFQRASWQPWAITERLYLNAKADHAPEVMSHIVKAILDDPARFPGVEMAKVSGPAAVSGRAENIVLYTTGPEATKRVLEEMQRYQAAHPQAFQQSVPQMTEQVGPGMAIGAEPVKYGGSKSFGSLRAEVIAGALTHAVQQGLDRAGFGRLVDEGLRAEDIDPARPHQNLSA